MRSLRSAGAGLVVPLPSGLASSPLGQAGAWPRLAAALAGRLRGNLVKWHRLGSAFLEASLRTPAKKAEMASH